MKNLKTTQLQPSFKVLLIGDSCIDRYVIGVVERLSQEAPVPVIKIINEYSLHGMSSNVKLNLENLGIEVLLITSNTEITKTRYIDNRSGQHLIRVDDEPAVISWNSNLPNEKFDAIVISDYNKGFLTYENIEYIIQSFACPVIIDTKKKNLSRFSANNSIIKINEHESHSMVSVPSTLIVTLGEKGAMLKQGDQEKIYETNKVEVADVCGAGDTFLSAFTYKFLETMSIEQGIIFANLASSITVQHRGNYAPSHQEIFALCLTNPK
jgi:D-beta-D-heptose 7-phosphate kinase/D-beta-D-heptose 1-phosphate adenosyltransferase